MRFRKDESVTSLIRNCEQYEVCLKDEEEARKDHESKADAGFESL